MSNVSQWDTNPNNNNATPPDGWPEGMARAAVNDSARENMAALARWYQDLRGGLVTAGTATAYTLTTSSAHGTLAAQSMLTFRVHATNTGAATLNVDGLGARPLRTPLNQGLPPGALLLNSTATVVYNSALDVYVLVSASAVEAAGVPVPLQLTDADDLNTLTSGPRVQFYRWAVASTPANAPEASAAAAMAAYASLDNRQTQVVFMRDTNREFRRTYNGTSWSAWAQILDDARLASQGQAEAGTSNTTWMSPLRTRQAIVEQTAGWQLQAAVGPSGGQFVVTNLGGWRDLMVTGRNVSNTLNNRRAMQVSTNNGSSFIGSGNYRVTPAGNTDDIALSDSSTANRGFVLVIEGWDGSLAEAVITTQQIQGGIVATEIIASGPFNAFRIQSEGGGSLGGNIRVYGRGAI